MKNEHQLLYKVMQHFEGMQKIEAFDLIHKMEVVLYYASSPIKSFDIQKILMKEVKNQPSEIDPFHFTILPNGNFCEFVGCNHWIHIYKEVKRGISRWSPFETYYYKTTYAPLEICKLTQRNLRESTKGTPKQNEIEIFLYFNKVISRDPNTNEFRLLEE